MCSILGRIYLMGKSVMPCIRHIEEDDEDESVIFLLGQSVNMSLKTRSIMQILMSARRGLLIRPFYVIQPHNLSKPPFLRVLNWNILAQTLAEESAFTEEMARHIDWRYRRYYIIQEIVQHQPDVICLQEVDHFRFIHGAMITAGYVGEFLPKPDSPCIHFRGNNGPDGLAIFYRTETFSSGTWTSRTLTAWGMKTDQVALGVTLRTRSHNLEVFVSTTHLKSPTSEATEAVRNAQGVNFLRWVEVESRNCPVIICGTFNGDPQETIYRRVMCHPMDLQSAYRYNGSEPEYTKWKVGIPNVPKRTTRSYESKECVDYIFHSKTFVPVKVLEIPRPEFVSDDRFPCEEYPSDHLAMIADFELNRYFRCSGPVLRETAL